MPGHNALRQRFLQRFDRIALVQGTEGWRDFEGARTYLVDGMTLCAIDQREVFTLLRILCCGRRHAGQQRKRDEGRACSSLADQRHRRRLALSATSRRGSSCCETF